MRFKPALPHQAAVCIVLAACFGAPAAVADVITEWNQRSGEFITAAALGTPPANRVMAIVQTAAYEAANAITQRYPATGAGLEATPGASVDAAVAAAHRVVLTRLVPSQQPAIERAYQTAVSALADTVPKSAGIAVGEEAAAMVLAARADDAVAAQENYRPRTSAGTYVPTVLPAVPQWPQRRPWLMATRSVPPWPAAAAGQ